MFDLEKLIRPQVRDLKAYHVNEPSVDVKLHANESPCNLDKSVVDKISAEIQRIDFNRYPDAACEDVRNILAGQLSVEKDQILAGNGSDELIQMIIMAFGGHGSPVIIPHPTFSMYKNIAFAMGEEVKVIPLDENFDLDRDAMVSEVKKGPSITFISYPNNPTGNCFSEETIRDILEASKGIVVIDEAYFDYSKKSFLDSLGAYPHMIILRTLSKIGMASLRLGILIASRSMADIINRVRLPYNIGSLQQRAACIALKERERIDRESSIIIEERERVFAEMKKIENIDIFNSHSNFILFRIDNGGKIFDKLVKKGVLVRNFDSEGPLKNCLRVTMGTPLENDIFLSNIKNI
ncbi:MAG: histidinol-phosphate transaminase [Deltaproteobacteria bacterium]|nr:histidinol-phosphate transaminase [Deltaproteobacteria bacterium]